MPGTLMYIKNKNHHPDREEGQTGRASFSLDAGMEKTRAKDKVLHANTRSRTQHLSGSLTVEAALCLPLLLFSCFLLLTPCRVMEERRQLQNRMEAVAKDAAMAAYVVGTASALLEEKNGTEHGMSEEWLKPVSEAAAAVRILAGTQAKHLKRMRFELLEFPDFASQEEKAVSEGTEIAEQADSMIRMTLACEMHMPFPVFRLPAVKLTSVVNRRAWIGAKGGRGRFRFGEEGKQDGFDVDDAGNKLVYVGKNGTRYHIDRHCHYIDNRMRPVDGTSIDALRNSYGGRYHACVTCKPGKSGIVYIFESGSSYHADTSCRAISSSASIYKIEEVAHLGPCSYCSKGKAA